MNVTELTRKTFIDSICKAIDDITSDTHHGNEIYAEEVDGVVQFGYRRNSVKISESAVVWMEVEADSFGEDMFTGDDYADARCIADLRFGEALQDILDAI